MFNHCKVLVAFLVVFVNVLGTPGVSDAGFLYHAARKASVGSILKGGLNPSKFRPKSRLGEGGYLARKPSTALAEKGESSSVVRMEDTKILKQNTWDLRNPTPNKLHGLLGEKTDLRGTVKNRVIGPKIGRRLGKLAGEEGKAIEYRSAKNGGSNLFIPKKLFEKHPRIVSPDKAM